MTKIETLRTAAALIRERAEAATPGPWTVEPDDGGDGYSVALVDAAEYDGTERDNSAHIAAWHPAVALAVAAWLEHQAEWLERDTKRGMTPTPSDHHALAVASAYLGDNT